MRRYLVVFLKQKNGRYPRSKTRPRKRNRKRNRKTPGRSNSRCVWSAVQDSVSDLDSGVPNVWHLLAEVPGRIPEEPQKTPGRESGAINPTGRFCGFGLGLEIGLLVEVWRGRQMATPEKAVPNPGRETLGKTTVTRVPGRVSRKTLEEFPEEPQMPPPWCRDFIYTVIRHIYIYI